ncbi:hypothetical protein IGK15_001667 [Enterococcus sp. AZ045]|uniref:hypothetical protein n=1 Tax=Enterococcus TaxID=1350 RepID=UPI000789B163|nr:MULTISPECIES: hypothetical protein [Enterococcus]MCA6774910.1 hypothetical protein [Enterococcus mundtii]UBM06807.1 hypothetical protein K9N66_06530 [Enterococcus mundtii]
MNTSTVLDLNHNTTTKFVQKKIIFALSFSFLCVFLTNLLPALNFSIFEYAIFQQMPKILLFISYLYALPSFIKRINTKILYILYGFIGTVTINLLFQNNLHQFLTTITVFSYSCLPVLLFVTAIDDFKQLYSYFYRSSLFVATLLIVLSLSGVLEFSAEYSMGFSYSTIFYFIFLINDFFFTKRISSLLFSLPIFLVIFAYGSRGALVCILSFFLFRLTKNIFQKKHLLQSLMLILVIFVTYLNLNNILLFIQRIFHSLNIQSRTLTLMLQNEIDYSAGRDVLYTTVIEAIKKDPLAIRGINADYNLLGIYSHNILLELVYQFGVIIGSILITILLIIVSFTLFKKYSFEFDSLIIIILAIWSSQLMVSYSLWISIYFWFFIGLFINKCNTKEKHFILTNSQSQYFDKLNIRS